MVSNDRLKGLLFDVQGFSVHDGPGCRTLVFLKGCPLNCLWCSNPEGINPHSQVMYYRDSCVANKFSCKEACKNDAIKIEEGKEHIAIDRSKCNQCVDFTCIDACDYNALRVSGYYLTVEELMKKIQRDRNYWGSNGGVTLSGGEPMFQYEFTKAVLQKCYDSYIHTGMETSGYAPWKYYKQVIDLIEWLFYDIKHMDPKIHKEGTGKPNDLVLSNAKKLASKGDCRVIFRIPVIPGYNDSVDNIHNTAKFINSINKNEVNILPIHHLGSSKYDLLGINYSYNNDIKVAIQKMKEIQTIFSDYSIKCYIGSNTPF